MGLPMYSSTRDGERQRRWRTEYAGTRDERAPPRTRRCVTRSKVLCVQARKGASGFCKDAGAPRYERIN
eukprot:1886272-Pleurochrysis_carterae.AAC.2